MDEYLVALFSPEAFARHIRGNWTADKVSKWHMACKVAANGRKPLLPAEYERVLAWEDTHRTECGRSGNGVKG